MRINNLPRPKSERGKDIILLLALFITTLGLFSLDWRSSLAGGVSTVGAERVLAGEIPYRDFWTMYAPGHFYLLALLFRVFGTHNLVEVVSASVIFAAAACACYLLVLNLGGKRLVAFLGAAIVFAAAYNTGYFKSLGTYPPTLLLIFTGLNFIAIYYKSGRRNLLFWAGLATGAAVVFKHDVGGYTAIAIVAGLIAHFSLQRSETITREGITSLLLKLGIYLAGITIIVLPILLYFAVSAGLDMARNLVIFPLTDFRFARPEAYPSLFPIGIYDPWRVKMLENLFNYLNFTLPFLLFLFGAVAIGLAIRRRQPDFVAVGVTFSVAYLFHWVAAHVQINTHIISMTAYGALLGLLFWGLAARSDSSSAGSFRRLSALALAGVWLLSLAAAPSYKMWTRLKGPAAELNLPKVSGFKVAPEEARNLTELAAYVDANIQPGQPIFIGLHRHDVVVIGDVMLYFVLNRPSATRYQELHPAITDTTHIQREMVANLRDKKIPLIVLRRIFPDETLESVKKSFLVNLPQIGATELDHYIRENYVESRRFGPYAVWQRKENAIAFSRNTH